ncbi:Hypothetical membrane protein [Zobellia galactanivorans]|uniref:Hypothetical membrane protein n=1 Tax=Zobellia galactanivorans (strain DSM 12802 / CCUG 47099 / CIP 106680 / NCIMB 13871 / Dsij) TaxID=63186 RepID=G0KZK1_ZOBGA|nr:Hypothetical membrane protein [Zobellia galactanivorans]
MAVHRSIPASRVGVNLLYQFAVATIDVDCLVFKMGDDTGYLPSIVRVIAIGGNALGESNDRDFLFCDTAPIFTTYHDGIKPGFYIVEPIFVLVIFPVKGILVVSIFTYFYLNDIVAEGFLNAYFFNTNGD